MSKFKEFDKAFAGNIGNVTLVSKSGMPTTFKKDPKLQDMFFRINGFKDSKKVLVIYGGRGGGKSQAACQFLLEESDRDELRNRVILCCREYAAQNTASIKGMLEFIIKDHPELESKFLIGRSKIENLRTGVKFYFVGLSDYVDGSAKKDSNLAKIKGMSNLAYVFMDEAETVSEESLDVLMPTGRALNITYMEGREPKKSRKDGMGDNRTKFIFTMNRQKEEDVVIKYFSDKAWADDAIIERFNIFDITPIKDKKGRIVYPNQDMIKQAESLRVSDLAKFNHMWMGEPKMNTEECLFDAKKFHYMPIDWQWDSTAYRYIVVGVDPAMSSNAKSDLTGIVVVGLGKDRNYYVLEDKSGRYTPDGWGKMVVSLYNKYSCNFVVAEVNQGGNLIESNIKACGYGSNVKVRAVTSRLRKEQRASGASTLHSSDRIMYSSGLNEGKSRLVNQLINFRESGYYGADKSPDAADAFVHAVNFLIEREGRGAGLSVLGINMPDTPRFGFKDGDFGVQG